MIRLFFCEECGARFWTFAADPIPGHDCTADQFTLQRMDLSPMEYRHSVTKIPPDPDPVPRAAPTPVTAPLVGVAAATDYDVANPRSAS